MPGSLCPKQRKFVNEYLLDLNATKAALRAGYSERTARAQGARLLTKVDIQRAIEEAQAERAQRVQITADWVLTRLREESQERGEGASHSARVKALELLGKHLALFVDRHQHTGADGGPIQIVEVVRPHARPGEHNGRTPAIELPSGPAQGMG